MPKPDCSYVATGSQREEGRDWHHGDWHHGTPTRPTRPMEEHAPHRSTSWVSRRSCGSGNGGIVVNNVSRAPERGFWRPRHWPLSDGSIVRPHAGRIVSWTAASFNRLNLLIPVLFGSGGSAGQALIPPPLSYADRRVPAQPFFKRPERARIRTSNIDPSPFQILSDPGGPHTLFLFYYQNLIRLNRIPIATD